MVASLQKQNHGGGVGGVNMIRYMYFVFFLLLRCSINGCLMGLYMTGHAVTFVISIINLVISTYFLFFF